MENQINTILQCHSHFINVCDTCINQVAKATEMYQLELDIPVRLNVELYYTIIEQSFLTVFLNWEYFLENSFILFMCRKSGLNGNIVAGFVHNVDQEHAFKMLKGIKQFPDWTNIEFIDTMSKVYFQDGGPFAFLKNERTLIHAKKIRNRISHMSEKCKRDYEKVVLEYLGTLPTSNSVSEFLSTYSTTNKSTYFLYFIKALKAYADIICNPS